MKTLRHPELVDGSVLAVAAEGSPRWLSAGVALSQRRLPLHRRTPCDGFSTLKGWTSYSPGLERSDYPEFTPTRTNPVGVESIHGGSS